MAHRRSSLVFVAAPLLTLLVRSLRVGGAWSLENYRDLATTGPGEGAAGAGVRGARELLAGRGGRHPARRGCSACWSRSWSRAGPGRAAGAAALAVLDALFMLPLGVSAVTLGFGFLITLDRPPLDLRSSAVLVPIAQAMVALPLVVRTLAPVLRSVDPRQRQAAASLGASPFRVLLTVDLPALWRPLLAATGFAFAVSLGEFGATSFLARPDRPTLPVVIYQLISAARGAEPRDGAGRVGGARAGHRARDGAGGAAPARIRGSVLRCSRSVTSRVRFDEVPAVDEVSLDLPAGEVLAVLGPSGSRQVHAAPGGGGPGAARGRHGLRTTARTWPRSPRTGAASR